MVTRQRSATEEVWAEIPGYPGYIASTLGNIMGPSGRVLKWQHHKKKKSGKSYPNVEIREKQIPVHKLILTTFAGPRPPNMQCRHLNDNPDDNRLENICWGTQLDNHIDAIKNGRIGCLTTKEINFIRASTRTPLRTIAAQLKLSKSAVQLIRTRQTWKADLMRAVRHAKVILPARTDNTPKNLAQWRQRTQLQKEITQLKNKVSQRRRHTQLQKEINKVIELNRETQ
jgi:HNH endonuclease